MQNNVSKACRWLRVTGVLSLSLTLLFCGSAAAQNLVQNGDFEAPMPGLDATTNWSIVYVECGPSDFSIAGQTTEASAGGGGRGAHLRGNNYNFAHAYFRQVIRTGITNGDRYNLTIGKMQAAFQNYVDSGKLQVYLTAISGSSSQTIYANGTAQAYSLIVTGTPSRTVEIQLHMQKGVQSADVANDFKSSKTSGVFDEISLTRIP